METIQFYKNISDYICKHYGYSINKDRTFKTIKNDVQIFVSIIDNEIAVGYYNIANDKDILTDILSGKHFEKYFSGLVIDEEMNSMYKNYLLKDDENMSESIYLFNCLSELEIKYTKHSVWQKTKI